MVQRQQKNMPSQNKNQNKIESSQQKKFQLIDIKDINLLGRAQKKILITPLIFISLTIGIWAVGRKLNIGKILSNPLLTTNEAQRKQLRWKYILSNGILMGTVAMCVGAYFKKQVHKYSLYKKYQSEVNHYVRWKINKRIQRYLSE